MQSASSFTRIRDLFQQSEFLAKQGVLEVGNYADFVGLLSLQTLKLSENDFEIELCVGLRVLSVLFHIGLVVGNVRSVFSFDLHECFT